MTNQVAATRLVLAPGELALLDAERADAAPAAHLGTGTDAGRDASRPVEAE